MNNQTTIASPYIAHNPADLHVTFWFYGYTMNEGDTLWAGVMTNPDVDSSFIPLTTITSSNLAYEYVQYEFYTGSLADRFSNDDSICIAFRSVMGVDYYSMTIILDDIVVDAMGDCLAPNLNSGNIDSISYEGVQLSWQCSSEPEDGYVVRLLNTQNQSYAYYDSPEDSLLIEDGLAPNTLYEAWVATVCGDDTTSYTSIGSFTTHYRCYAVANPTVAALTANAAALTWDFTGTGIEPTSVEVVLMDLSDSSTTTLNVTDDNCIFTSLTEGHMYVATFTTYCGDEDTSWSVSVSFMPHTAPCAEFAGTNTSNYVPFYSYYNNGFSEMLYSGTEFAGFDSVTGISFDIANPINRDNIIDIWMGYVPDSVAGLTTSAYMPVDSMVHVVSNYSFSSANSGWLDMIPFDTLFPTQATGNVVIAVYNHTGSYINGLSWRTHTSTVGSSVYRYTDSYIDPTQPFDGYTSGTTTDAPNIQVYGTCSGGDCVAPGARVASADTHSVTLTWLPGGSESSWNVLYRESGATNWINYGPAATVPLTITGLNAGTDYQFRVGSDCGDTIVYGNAITGTTLCGPTAAPFTIVPTGVNNCWTYTGGGYYSDYGNYYYFYYGGSIMTPVIADSINTLQLRVSVYGAPYYVGVCDADGQNITWMDTVTPNDDYIYEYKKTFLHHYTGNGTNIIIRSGNGYVYVNEITVEPLDDCLPVENLAVDSVTTTDAWLSWTSDGNSFRVEYMDEADTTNTWLTATSATNSIHLTGMNSNTRYQVKVFNVCGATSQSDSVTIRLVMGCTPFTTPYLEQFGYEELPVCWNNVATGSISTTFAMTAEYGYDYVYSYGPYTGSQVDWLMTPEIQVPTDAENYRFLYYVGGGAYPYTGYPNSLGAYDLYISTTGSGDTSLYTTLLLSDTLDSRTSSTTYVNPASVSLEPYAGQTVSLAFRARTAQYGAVYVAQVEARFAGEPRYYLSGNGTAFVGENNAYVANYLEGALDSMTYTWTSTMATAGHATMTDANTDTMHIVYNAPGTDTLMFVASNEFGSDTIYGAIYVYQCDVITTYPWVEDFEEAGALACWRQQGNGEWVVGSGDGNTYTPITAHSGNGNAVITHTDRGNTTKLITPVFNLAGTPNATLSFWHIQRVWSGDQDELHVYYRNAPTAEWTLLTSYTNDIQNWTCDTVNLPNTSATYQIAFEMVDDYGYGVAIDSVVVMGVSANCYDPEIVSTEAEETTITFNWTGEASNYEVAIAEEWNLDSITAVAVTDTFYTFNGLTAATTY
ncbi:MAG: fibronectin type III domain-containing protein, partial [Bacteroidales bacterium]|nr:fibronectin type III domain-containing protein [Bacteroidales bacterium]